MHENLTRREQIFADLIEVLRKQTPTERTQTLVEIFSWLPDAALYELRNEYVDAKTVRS